jgi:hypothetical protein
MSDRPSPPCPRCLRSSYVQELEEYLPGRSSGWLVCTRCYHTWPAAEAASRDPRAEISANLPRRK